MTLEEEIAAVQAPDQEAEKAARLRWRQIAKPLGGLGVLEEDLIRIAAAQGSADISLEHKWIAVMCADNGVVAEGVSQTGQEVTAAVARGMARQTSCVCRMARVAAARVLAVDVGIAAELPEAWEPAGGLLNRRVAAGTKDFLKGPAMSRDQARRAMEAGLETAAIIAGRGCRIAGCGEMGIGNTTTASALAAVFLGRSPAEVTGRGAGLSGAGLARKTQVIEEGIRLHRPQADDPLGTLACLGGFDLAALAGFYIGCAARRIPVVLDGLITGAAALAAVRLCPPAGGYFLASHRSAEPAAALILEALELRAAIAAGFCLGEGSGAAALFPMLEMALAIYRDMDRFEEMKIEAYRPLR